MLQGSAIVADNIISPGAPEYKEYMEVQRNVYSSTLHDFGFDAIMVSIVN